jgi:E3 ubiquitin-protein ligase makorin
MDEFYIRMMNFSQEDVKKFLEKPKEEETKPICPYFLEGRCRYGERCWMTHPSGDNMEILGDKECGICLHKIRESNREFGLLLGCTHTFCLQCIRKWRGQLNAPKDVVRSCPLCRTLSHYIIPSPDFIESYQEKMKLADQYKVKLGNIPCKFFNFGEGTCPFGSSCFYDHRYRNGEKWVPPVPIFEVNENGEWGVAKKPKLSELLNL